MKNLTRPLVICLACVCVVPAWGQTPSTYRPRPFPPAVRMLTRVGGATLTWGQETTRSLEQADPADRGADRGTDPGADPGRAWAEDTRTLVGAQLSGPAAADPVLARLHEIKSLRTLSIWRSSRHPLDDQGLRLVSRVPNLEFLTIAGNSISDAGLRWLQSAGRLQGLVLEPAEVSDQGLEYLSGLQCLQVLSLNGAAISDAGLASLQNLHRLRFLSLRGTQVTPAALAVLRGSPDPVLMEIGGLRSLNTLVLPEDTRLDQDGVVQLIQLMGMSNLTRLLPLEIEDPNLRQDFETLRAQVEALKERHAFAEFEVSDDGVLEVVGLYFQRENQKDGDIVTNSDLSDLPGTLKRLSLRGCEVSDDRGGAIQQLAGLSRLEVLNLYDTGSARQPGVPWTPGITDRGLDELSQLELPNLRTVILDDDTSRISAEAVERFRQARPNVEVVRIPLEATDSGEPACGDDSPRDPRLRTSDSLARSVPPVDPGKNRGA